MIVDESVRRLQTLVDRMVAESGSREEFDGERWLSGWLQGPIPALGGRCPREELKEQGGFERVRNLLSRMQSGAYG